ncbi:MAG: magnesium transporter CorA [Lachnospiraceae bacterium]|nr:magnesium transporter CorA [Lachnospiraceae bacterium]
MELYLIKEVLEKCEESIIANVTVPYVAILSEEEWTSKKEMFDVGIDIEPNFADILVSEANVNYDSVTGTFCIPDRGQPDRDEKFAFVLDEKGIIFIENTDMAKNLTRAIQNTKKWKLPSLARFVYDFMTQITIGDVRMLENYEKEMRAMEADIIADRQTVTPEKVALIRNNIQTLLEHYEQLRDIAQIFEENENNFFDDENMRYFRMLLDRIDRLREKSTGLHDYTAAIRDLYKTHLDIKQNRIMTVLTVITSIFSPLTLITGWYGMNFAHMPELTTTYGYPVVIVLSVAIVLTSIIYFKKKNWF